MADLAAAMFDTTVSPDVRALLDNALRDASAETVVFLASYFPDLPALVAHLRTGAPAVETHLPTFQDGPVRAWREYCVRLDARLRGDTEGTEGAFGMCRRCGSRRLLVRTQQLRRADEGMTEIRTCLDCGAVSRTNS